MLVSIQHHQVKAHPYVRALALAGHRLVSVATPADAFLIDLDLPDGPYRDLIDLHVQRGTRAFLYPHGAGPVCFYGWLSDPYPPVSGSFVIGEGNAEILRRCGDTRPIHVIGWPYCEQLPFRPARARRPRVLFAPFHPLENGFLPDFLKEDNRRTFDALRRLPVELTVRHLGTVEQNGLELDGDVRWVQGLPDGSLHDIDAADIVVASETFAHLAIARGVPTVMFGQDQRPSNGEHSDTPVYNGMWERFRLYARYPFDIADGPAADVLAAAATGAGAIASWRDRFIGAPMDPAGFAAQLEWAVEAARAPAPPSIETRSQVALAMADEVIARPELLKRYAEHVKPDDDATLVLYAPGAAEEKVVAELERLFVDLDFGEDLPDLVLHAPAVRPGDEFRALRCASVLLSDDAAPRISWLPRLGSQEVEVFAGRVPSG